VPLKQNPGYLPADCLVRDEARQVIGHRRVRVVLFGGVDSARKEPGGWASGGRGACNWAISPRPHPFEIRQYEVI